MKGIIKSYILKIINKLNDNGFDAYIVGGAVRDFYNNMPIKDFDIATNAKLNDVEKIFNEYTIKKYKKGHTLGIIIDNNYVEVSTFDGNNIIEDLANRDFSINSMAYNINDGLIEPYNGLNDLKNKIIKAIRPLDYIFNNDPLRMLRAIRFEGILNFKLDDEITSYINMNSSLINNVAKERITKELTYIFMSDKPSRLIRKHFKMFTQLFPPLAKTYKFEQKNKWHYLDVFEHIMLVLDNTKPDLVLRLSAFFHDIEKPKCFTIDENNVGHFYNHFIESAITAKYYLKEYKFSNNIINRVYKLIYFHDYRLELRRNVILNFLNKFGISDLDLLFELKRADNSAQNQEMVKTLIPLDEIIKYINDIILSNDLISIRKLKINKDHLLNLGFKKENINEILDDIFNKVINDELINEKRILIEYVKNNIKKPN